MRVTQRARNSRSWETSTTPPRRPRHEAPPAGRARRGRGRWWARRAARRRSGSAAARRAPPGRPDRRRARSSARPGRRRGRGRPAPAGSGRRGPARRWPASGRARRRTRRRRPGSSEPSAAAACLHRGGGRGGAGAAAEVVGDGLARRPARAPAAASRRRRRSVRSRRCRRAASSPPASRRSSVDLPAPLAPTTPTTSPGATVRSRGSKRVRWAWPPARSLATRVAVTGEPGGHSPPGPTWPAGARPGPVPHPHQPAERADVRRAAGARSGAGVAGLGRGRDGRTGDDGPRRCGSRTGSPGAATRHRRPADGPATRICAHPERVERTGAGPVRLGRGGRCRSGLRGGQLLPTGASHLVDPPGMTPRSRPAQGGRRPPQPRPDHGRHPRPPRPRPPPRRRAAGAGLPLIDQLRGARHRAARRPTTARGYVEGYGEVPGDLLREWIAGHLEQGSTCGCAASTHTRHRRAGRDGLPGPPVPRPAGRLPPAARPALPHALVRRPDPPPRPRRGPRAGGEPAPPTAKDSARPATTPSRPAAGRPDPDPDPATPSRPPHRPATPTGPPPHPPGARRRGDAGSRSRSLRRTPTRPRTRRRLRLRDSQQPCGLGRVPRWRDDRPEPPRPPSSWSPEPTAWSAPAPAPRWSSAARPCGPSYAVPAPPRPSRASRSGSGTSTTRPSPPTVVAGARRRGDDGPPDGLATARPSTGSRSRARRCSPARPATPASRGWSTSPPPRSTTARPGAGDVDESVAAGRRRRRRLRGDQARHRRRAGRGRRAHPGAGPAAGDPRRRGELGLELRSAGRDPRRRGGPPRRTRAELRLGARRRPRRARRRPGRRAGSRPPTDPERGPVAGGCTVVNVAAGPATVRDYYETVTGALGVEPVWEDAPAWTGRILAERARGWGWEPQGRPRRGAGRDRRGAARPLTVRRLRTGRAPAPARRACRRTPCRPAPA